MRATWGAVLLCGLAGCLTPHPMDGGVEDASVENVGNVTDVAGSMSSDAARVQRTRVRGANHFAIMMRRRGSG